MSEWTTYSLDDFVMFSPRTWYGLLAAHNRAWWPLQPAVMLLGAGISADRIIGGFDSGWNGETVDLSTGETMEDGHVLAVESVGAALLALLRPLRSHGYLVALLHGGPRGVHGLLPTIRA